MPVPKRKVSKSRRNMRRAHLALDIPQLVGCNNCGSLRVPHNMCGTCGFYKGKLVLQMSGARPTAAPAVESQA